MRPNHFTPVSRMQWQKKGKNEKDKMKNGEESTKKKVQKREKTLIDVDFNV